MAILVEGSDPKSPFNICRAFVKANIEWIQKAITGGGILSV